MTVWDTPWPEWLWHLELTRLAERLAGPFAAAGLPRLDLQNLQNVLCEFDKFERTRETGQIPPSQRYKPADATPLPRPKAKRGKKLASETVAPPPEPEPAAPPPTDATAPADAESPIDKIATEPHCLAAALDYAQRYNWKIFLAPPGAKKSHRKAPPGGERWGATRDPDEIRQDFARWPDSNIGIPTDRDNNFWVLEADTKAGGHDYDGLAALGALMAQHGPLPETRTAESPSGSRHYYFKWPAGLTIRNSTSTIGPGLDTRGDGGMVIAPPSLRDGKPYCWISEAEIAEAPPWLLDLMARLGVAIPDTGNPQPRVSGSASDGGYIPDPEALAPLSDIAAALAAVPVTSMDADYNRWITYMHATFAASGGSDEGLALFDAWTQPSAHYDAEGLEAKWRTLRPDRIGFDYLASEASKADPDWRLKAARANTERAKQAGDAHQAGDGASSSQGQQQGQQQTPPGLLSLQASDVDIEALEWLWPGRFALGKLGLIAGLPDEGKGLLTMAMAARVTNPELEWPCGEGKAPQGNVILFTAEDDLADTVVPRLKAAGADLARVHIIRLVLDTDKFDKPRRRMFSLRHDLAMLRAKIAAIGDVRMIVIDPITAYLGVGEIDSFRDADVRAVLAPLQDLAAELHVAVIAIMHFNKKVDVLNLLLRVCNSIAFTAAARHAFGVVYDSDHQRRLLVRGKNNLAKRDDRALAFRVDAFEVGRDKRNGLAIEAPFLIWDAEYVEITATEALQAATENKAPGARNTAKKFLRELLRNGPVAATEIEKAAKAEGITTRTLHRAKQELGIVAKKDGPDGKWQWYLHKEDGT
jgi:hypothetical protein